MDNFIIKNSQRAISISLPSAQKVLHFLLKKSKKKEVSLHFVGRKKISSLHATYFNDPSPTDCITFPYEDPIFLGEIFVCPQTALKYARQHGGALYEEITLYVVHGFLHLMGYEDHTLQGKKKMRIQEKKWMAALAKNTLGITP